MKSFGLIGNKRMMFGLSRGKLCHLSVSVVIFVFQMTAHALI